jgi:hypothetical protein
MTTEDCAKIENVGIGVDLLVSVIAVSPIRSTVAPEDWCKKLKRQRFKTKGILVYDEGFLGVRCKDCESRRHGGSLDLRFAVLP